MYVYYMKVVEVLVYVTTYYTNIHYWMYVNLMNGAKSIDNFYFTDINVGLWMATALSLYMCFSMMFISTKDLSDKKRRLRRVLKIFLVVFMLLGPVFALVIIFGFAFFIIYLLYRKVKYTYIEFKLKEVKR